MGVRVCVCVCVFVCVCAPPPPSGSVSMNRHIALDVVVVVVVTVAAVVVKVMVFKTSVRNAIRLETLMLACQCMPIKMQTNTQFVYTCTHVLSRVTPWKMSTEG